LCRLPTRMINAVITKSVTNQDAPLSAAEIEDLENFDTTYDVHAQASYATFASLKSRGEIPQDVRFQISIPSPNNVIASLAHPLQAQIEPYYTAALLRAVRNITKHLPHDQIAIQIDMAVDFALIEGADTIRLRWTQQKDKLRVWRPWWDGDVEDGVVERVLSFLDSASLPQEVELGFHFCYGDQGHEHFVQPKDTSTIARVMHRLSTGLNRPIQWVHFPVPGDRCLDDSDTQRYLDPLAAAGLVDKWCEQETEVYPGTCRENDEDGSQKRAGNIKKWCERQEKGGSVRWGISAECGLGRVKEQDLTGLLNMMAKLSASS
jgi:hypothetical protein